MTEQNTDESPVVTIFGEEYNIEDLKPEEHRQIARLQNLKARFENTINQISGLQEDAHDLQLAIAKREMDLKNSVKAVEEEPEKEVVQQMDEGLAKAMDMDQGQKALQEINAHERECALRYERIEERLTDGSRRFDRIERMLWGVIILIIGSLLVPQFLGV